MPATAGKRKRTPKLWIALGFLALSMGLPALLTLREHQRQQRNLALITAIKAKDTAKAIALLEAGADANTLNAPPNTYTLQNLLTDCWNTLDGTPAPPIKPPDYYPVLFLLLPESGTPVSSPGYRSVSAPADARLLQAMLDHGADPNIKNKIRNSPLAIAVKERNSVFVRLLLEHGANPNCRDLFQCTPLFLADKETARLLLERGADPNAKDLSGRTSLILAAQQGDTETVRLLLDRGARLNERDRQGMTALAYARKTQKQDLVHLLLQAGVNE